MLRLKTQVTFSYIYSSKQRVAVGSVYLHDKTWPDVRCRYCSSQGMSIASVHNQEEDDVVRSLVNSASYLGAIESTKNGVWKWADGTSWDYTDPSNDGLANIRESRLAFYPSTPRWRDWENGGAALGVVCRKGTGVPIHGTFLWHTECKGTYASPACHRYAPSQRMTEDSERS